MARQASGQLIRRATGWFARVTVTIEGERVRVMRDLGTQTRAVAQKRLEKLLGSDGPATDVGGAETFEEAARRVCEQRAAVRPAWAAEGLGWLERFAFEHIGKLRVTAIKPSHVSAVLLAVRDAGKSRMSAHHVRQWCRNVFTQLVTEEAVPSNPCDAAVMPEYPQEIERERAVLTDAELAIYLGYEPSDRRAKGGTLERQVLGICSRVLGGMRRGDLHHLKWGAFELEGFSTIRVPRRKTKRPQLLGVPEMARPIVADWYVRSGSPGPEALVFPVRKGSRAGQVKRGVCHAGGLRRDLQAAFKAAAALGIEAPAEGSQRWLELFEDSEETLRVDFHSFRRGFVQGLGDAGVNAQTAQALAGHASLEAHARYLRNAGKLRELPAAALPQITISNRQLPSGSAPVCHGTPVYSDPAEGAEMPGKTGTNSATGEFLNRRSPVRIRPGTPENADSAEEKAADLPIEAAADPVEQALADALQRAAAAEQWTAVETLSRELTARREARANVVHLPAKRRGGK